MTAEEVIKLINAGFTKDEITSMSEPKQPDPEGNSEKGTEESKCTEDHTAEKDAQILELTKQLNEIRNDLKKAQEANLKGAEGGKEPEKKMTSADVIKSFMENL